MRIVTDTNTVLSGLLWSGPPRFLIDRARERIVTLCTSRVLLAEFADVISRDKFARRIELAGRSAAQLAQDYRDLIDLVEPQALGEPVCRDPDDDHVLACALSASADLIVTRDLDLLALKTYRDIPILRAADALRRIDARR